MASLSAVERETNVIFLGDDTPAEIISHTLSFLAPKIITQSQLVCRRWNVLCQTTPHLRRCINTLWAKSAIRKIPHPLDRAKAFAALSKEEVVGCPMEAKNTLEEAKTLLSTTQFQANTKNASLRNRCLRGITETQVKIDLMAAKQTATLMVSSLDKEFAEMLIFLEEHQDNPTLIKDKALTLKHEECQVALLSHALFAQAKIDPEEALAWASCLSKPFGEDRTTQWCMQIIKTESLTDLQSAQDHLRRFVDQVLSSSQTDSKLPLQSVLHTTLCIDMDQAFLIIPRQSDEDRENSYCQLFCKQASSHPLQALENAHSFLKSDLSKCQVLFATGLAPEQDHAFALALQTPDRNQRTVILITLVENEIARDRTKAKERVLSLPFQPEDAELILDLIKLFVATDLQTARELKCLIPESQEDFIQSAQKMIQEAEVLQSSPAARAHILAISDKINDFIEALIKLTHI